MGFPSTLSYAPLPEPPGDTASRGLGGQGLSALSSEPLQSGLWVVTWETSEGILWSPGSGRLDI